MKNREAIELFNLLNSKELAKVLPKNSHIEASVMKTLRRMNEFVRKHTEKMTDIDDEYAATEKNSKGEEILVKTTLKKTRIVDGKEETEEFQVPVYTKENEKLRQEAKRKFNELDVCATFEICKTADSACLTIYQQETLYELGFLKHEPKMPADAGEKEQKKE